MLAATATSSRPSLALVRRSPLDFDFKHFAALRDRYKLVGETLAFRGSEDGDIAALVPDESKRFAVFDVTGAVLRTYEKLSEVEPRLIHREEEAFNDRSKAVIKLSDLTSKARQFGFAVYARKPNDRDADERMLYLFDRLEVDRSAKFVAVDRSLNVVVAESGYAVFVARVGNLVRAARIAAAKG